MQSNKVIQGILTQEEAGRKFEQDLNKLIAESSHLLDKEKAQRAVGIDNAFKSQKKGRALKRLLFSSREEEQLREVIEGFFLYRLDELWNAGIDESLQYLDDRQTLKKRHELEDEYEGGRIYRLATDTRPILRDLAIKKEGHLFMDLRGFTRRMCVSKEISMADFMLKGFFLPVLEVAKKYYTDEGVRLNNWARSPLSKGFASSSPIRLPEARFETKPAVTVSVPRDLSARPVAKKIAEDAIYYLDAGIVEGWFLQYKDPGRMLWAIKRLYLKAIEEEIKDDKRPDIAYLTHLSLVAHLRKVKETLKKVNIKRFSYEKLEQAIGQMLYSTLKEIQRRSSMRYATKTSS